tara:strand:- start:318 stop:1439 length:1122 start_codon:yes stop_codon:yes gene_type:complete
MSEEAIRSSSEVLNSGYITQGPVVDDFENLLTNYFDQNNFTTTNSATSAIHLVIHMLKNYGIGDEKIKIETSEDHIITTPLTCTATNWPILLNDVNIRWVDVDEQNCNINLDDLETKLNKNTKALMLVHWGGYPVDLNRLKEIQDNFYKKYGFKFIIIEDCAHAFGSNLNGQKIGTFGNISTFSFQAIKHLTTVDGGGVIFPNKEDTDRAKLLRWYGIDRNENRKDFRCEEDISEIGFKFHMNDVNASIGISNFEHVKNNLLGKHLENGNYFTENLKNIDDIGLLNYTEKEVPFWIYTLKVNNRERFMNKMMDKNIVTSRVHERNDIHSSVKKFKTSLPILDKLVETMVCIPVGWWVTNEQRDYIIDTIKKGW